MMNTKIFCILQTPKIFFIIWNFSFKEPVRTLCSEVAW